MTDSRRRGGVALWLTVVVTAAVFYVASSGPGNWLTLKGYVPSGISLFVYAPLCWIVEHCPEAAQEKFGQWLSLWHPSDWDEKMREQIGEALANGMLTEMADDLAPPLETEEGDTDSDEPGRPKSSP